VAALALAFVAPLAGPDGDRVPTAAAGPPDGPDDRPNIVLFMTDDQNRNELRWMPKTLAALGRRGVTFTAALSPAPLCCPARAMVVTGQYGHNNGVAYNRGAHGGFHALMRKQNTLARWLHNGGYQTALVGKYLNGYEGHFTPPQTGWTRWHPSVRHIYDYRGATFLDGDGTRRFTKNTSTVISDYTASVVREFSESSAPFFLWVSHLAPHGASRQVEGRTVWGPPRPSSKHADVLGDVRLPSLSKQSFNDPGTGPQPYPGRPELSARRLQAVFTGRLRALQDVDDALRRLVLVLKRTGELANTYIIFVSDNGHLLGEHRIIDKNVLYQEALTVPMMVRVPGQTTGTTSAVPVTVVDLAPTIAELAGVPPERVVDGVSFTPLLRGQRLPWRDTQLVQTGSTRARGPDPGWEFRGVRTVRYTYMRRAVDGAELLLDRRRHPSENATVGDDPRYRTVLRQLRHRFQVLDDCAGTGCNQSFGPLPPLPPPQQR
jgi:arylsulfatase A-like enzyme